MKKPFVLIWGGVLLFALFTWIYLPPLSKYQDLKVRQEGMDLQIKELAEKVNQLREERDLLKNDVGYLEKIIRDELGLVKPGEIVYKFVPDQPAAVHKEKAAENKTAQTVKPKAPAEEIKPLIKSAPKADSGSAYPRQETR